MKEGRDPAGLARQPRDSTRLGPPASQELRSTCSQPCLQVGNRILVRCDTQGPRSRPGSRVSPQSTLEEKRVFTD